MSNCTPNECINLCIWNCWKKNLLLAKDYMVWTINGISSIFTSHLQMSNYFPISKWAINTKNQDQLYHHQSLQLDFYLVHNCPLSPASSQWHLTCWCLGNLAKSQALVSLAWPMLAQQLCQLLIINLTSMLLTNLWNGADLKSNHSVYVLSTITYFFNYYIQNWTKITAAAQETARSPPVEFAGGCSRHGSLSPPLKVSGSFLLNSPLRELLAV